MLAAEIDLAGRHLEVPVDEVNQPVREIRGKVRAEIGRAVLDQASCHVDPRKLLVGQADVRISFVVA